jgi:hypothetical protein
VLSLSLSLCVYQFLCMTLCAVTRCYMDYSTLVVDDPNNFMYVDGYFLLGGGWLPTEQSFIR